MQIANIKYFHYASISYDVQVTNQGVYKLGEVPNGVDEGLTLRYVQKYIGTTEGGVLLIIDVRSLDDEPLNSNNSIGSAILLDGTQIRSGSNPKWLWTTYLNTSLDTRIQQRAAAMLSIRGLRATADGVDAF